MPTDTGPVFAIPPVFDRPLGTEEGEHIFVKNFVLQGVEDDLAAGVRTAEIEARVQQRFDELNKLIENLRIKKQNRDKIDADGFTADERKKILDFVQGILSNENADNQVDAYQEFIQGLRLQRLERDQGLTIGQLQLVADEVTKYYRERGYFLARAVIPAQQVVGGIVTIRVLEGRLGGVVAEGNKRYEAKDLEAPFKSFEGKLINVARVEDALLTLQSYPGLSATGVFRPGRVVGTSDIVVNVQREDAQSFSTRVDNQGTRFTGVDRLVLDYTWLAPLHDADSLDIQAVQTYLPTNSLFGSLGYEAGLDDPSNRWGTSIGKNAFDVTNPATGAKTGVTGVARTERLYLTHQITRSRTSKTKLTMDLTHKTGDTLQTGNLLTRDEEAVLGVQLDTENISAATSTISSWFFRIDRGFPGVLGVPDVADIGTTAPAYSRNSATGSFFKASGGFSALKSITPTKSLLFRFAGQWSPDRLTSLEQFNMGGATSVRALETSAVLRDKAALFTFEYQTRGLWFGDKPAWSGRNWNQVLGTSLFYDYAIGMQNLLALENPSDLANQRFGLGGPGVSVDLTLPWEISMKLQYAHLTGGPRGSASDPSAIRDLNQTWIEFQRNF